MMLTAELDTVDKNQARFKGQLIDEQPSRVRPYAEPEDPPRTVKVYDVTVAMDHTTWEGAGRPTTLTVQVG